MQKQLALMLGTLWALLAGPALAADPASVCAAEVSRQEQLQQIPPKLLHSISLVESGRWDSERRVKYAWPWTVMAEGEGRFLPTKEAAIAEVKKLQARGVANIDVGCMQVNLKAHKTAFATLDEAFEPASNVGYAARFLVGLYSSTNDWGTAGSYYHSQTPNLAAKYKAKLMAAWQAERNGGDVRLAQLETANRPPLGMGLPSSRIASAQPPGTSHALRPGTPSRAERSAAERAEAKRIADAYRQARLEEYRLRRLQMQTSRG